VSEKAVDTRDLIFEVLRPFAEEKNIELSEASELASDLDLDSMKIMEVLLELEERLDILIPQNILPNVRTLADLARELDALKTT
jgi:acyl carrier protein